MNADTHTHKKTEADTSHTAADGPGAAPVLLNPQLVGQAENAHRPVLERILDRTATSFPQWVALRLAAADATDPTPGGTDRALLTARISDALKIDPEPARAALDQLARLRLLEQTPSDPSQVRLTESGRARFTQIKSAVDEVVAQVYNTIPQQELEIAARVLITLTRRLNAYSE